MVVPTSSALGRWSQGDQEFKASLCYIVSSRQKLHDILSLKTYK